MKKEIADMWVEALRSGEYAQTTGYLHDEHGYCCLGVLCELNKDVIIGQEDHDEIYYYAGESEILPEKVQVWAGMNTQNGVFLDDARAPLVDMNDDGATFEEIADIIENHYEEL